MHLGCIHHYNLCFVIKNKQRYMVTKTIQLFQKAGLAVASGGYQYSEVANAFLSEGFTSNAGNTYFNAVRLIEGIFIKEDVGQGHTRTFLNGIKIYSIMDKTLIAERSYHCKFHSKLTVISEVQEMLYNIINESALKEGIKFDQNEVRRKIQEITIKCFNSDQRQLLQAINNKSLTA